MPLSEFSLIYRYFSSLGRGDAVDLGVGDDCAILSLQPGERLATSVDTMVEGVHFPVEAFPEDIGYRAVAVAASDLAAMGARPIGMTLALTLPDADEFWLNTFSQGIAAAVSSFGLPLVGGDTTRGPLSISVQVMGALPATGGLLRGGAQVGDGVYVSGTLGDSAAGLSLLNGDWQCGPDAGEYLHRRFYRPEPRLALGLELLQVASAAIDISDGLIADAGHVAAASGVQLRIDSAALPLSVALQLHPDPIQALRWALSGGDDYELLACLPPVRAVPNGMTLIGQVLEGEGVSCDVDVGDQAGFSHF
ncbi:MAG: thiamine-phosphate kinase [Halieaceae bacterium]